MSSNEVKINFLLRVGERFYAESEIAKRINEVRKAVEEKDVDIVLPEGAVSIIYQGEELLGIELWSPLADVYAAPDKLLEGKSCLIYLSYQTLGIDLIPHEQGLVYRASSRTPRRPFYLERTIPLHSFIRSWTYMRIRIYKLQAYLGKAVAKEFLEEWENYIIGPWQEVVGRETIQRLVDADTLTTLISENCYGGYEYQDDKGFVKL